MGGRFDPGGIEFPQLLDVFEDVTELPGIDLGLLFAHLEAGQIGDMFDGFCLYHLVILAHQGPKAALIPRLQRPDGSMKRAIEDRAEKIAIAEKKGASNFSPFDFPQKIRRTRIDEA